MQLSDAQARVDDNGAGRAITVRLGEQFLCLRRDAFSDSDSIDAACSRLANCITPRVPFLASYLKFLATTCDENVVNHDDSAPPVGSDGEG